MLFKYEDIINSVAISLIRNENDICVKLLKNWYMHIYALIITLFQYNMFDDHLCYILLVLKIHRYSILI